MVGKGFDAKSERDGMRSIRMFGVRALNFASIWCNEKQGDIAKRQAGNSRVRYIEKF